jgi:uncharacterized YigZ family protein
MTPSRYPIPAETARIELQVVNSRFIATIGEARTAEEARAFLASVRREFPDATHNVHAFRAGYGESITEGMSDDGEPSGTAGKPALAVLRGADLGDVVLVITRYFGGTKLGTGGLVRAYTQAAQEALTAVPRGERVQRRHALAEVPYALYEQTKRLVSAHQGEIESEDFAGAVTLTLIFALEDCAGFEAELAELSAGQVPVIWLEGE